MAGLRSVDLPLGPPLELSYSDERYEKLWSAAEAAGMPISFHINSGTDLMTRRDSKRSGKLPYGVHKFDCMKVLGDLISAGVMERHPNLNFVIAEAGSGWIPFFAQEYDWYELSMGRSKLAMPPSDYLARQVYTVFISDPIAGELAQKHGANFMWSSDYPHPACTWPYATEIIAQDLGELDPETRLNITCLNAAKVYNGGRLPPPADPKPTEFQALGNWTVDTRVNNFDQGAVAAARAAARQ